jgi:hypothetical protein
MKDEFVLTLDFGLWTLDFEPQLSYARRGVVESASSEDTGRECVASSATSRQIPADSSSSISTVCPPTPPRQRTNSTRNRQGGCAVQGPRSKVQGRFNPDFGSPRFAGAPTLDFGRNAGLSAVTAETSHLSSAQVGWLRKRAGRMSRPSVWPHSAASCRRRKSRASSQSQRAQTAPTAGQRSA